jgi:hypothetical protein
MDRGDRKPIPGVPTGKSIRTCATAVAHGAGLIAGPRDDDPLADSVRTLAGASLRVAKRQPPEYPQARLRTVAGDLRTLTES